VASYAGTTDQLDRLLADVDLNDGPDRQAQFVADVERVLVAQNEGWTDLLSPKQRGNVSDPDQAVTTS
jgi:hypothetical protein